jgi:hypothetical protein
MKKVFLLIALISTVVFAEMKQYPYESMTNEQHKKLVTSGLEKVRMFFKDPDAVKFKNVVGTSDKQHDYPTHICGFANGKNSYGGYVGFKRFITTTKGNVIMIEGEESGFDFKWSLFCQ